MKKTILLGIIITSFFYGCDNQFTKKLTPAEQGYKDGINAMKKDVEMEKTFTEVENQYKKSTDTRERYILIQGTLKGSIKGTCMKLTWGNDNNKNKPYEYLKAFENGCWSVYWNRN